MKPYPWNAYSNKLTERVLSPQYVGAFEPTTGRTQEMRVVIGREGNLALYLVVDETDGIIADAKFQAFGPSALIGAADALCELVIRKSYLQASRIHADMIDKKLRDFDNIPAFPEETSTVLNLVLAALEEACAQCDDIEVIHPSEAPPVPFGDVEPQEGEYPNWEALTHDERLGLIKKVIAEEVAPFIELDAGGIEVLELKKGLEVSIAYSGACTSCPSATGATLNAIEQILRQKVHPSLSVKPDLSFLTAQH